MIRKDLNLRDVAIVMALCFLVFDTMVFQPSVAEGEGLIPDPEKREYFLYSGMTPGEYKKNPLKLAKDEFVAICNRKVDEKQLEIVNQKYGVKLLEKYDRGTRWAYRLKLPDGSKLKDVLTPFGNQHLPEVKAIKTYWNEEIIEFTLPTFFISTHDGDEPLVLTDEFVVSIKLRYEERLNAFAMEQGHLIEKGLPDNKIARLRSRYHPEYQRHTHLFRITRESSLNTLDMANFYHQQNFIRWSEPNTLMKIHLNDMPNDKYFKGMFKGDEPGQGSYNQWYLDEENNVDIDAPEAWDISKGETENPDEPVVIAVIDIGVDLDHPDLKNKILLPKNSDGKTFGNFALGEEKTVPDDTDELNDGHGTKIAGIAAAETNNNQGIAGVAWQAKILPVKISRSLDLYALGEAISYAADRAQVLNCSWALYPRYVGDKLQPIKEAIEFAITDRYRLVVCSSGNAGLDNSRLPNYPSCYNQEYDGVMSIGAIGRDGKRANYSNYGNIDVVAPSSTTTSEADFDIVTTQSGGGYGLFGGTSATASQVSGAAALMIAAYRKGHLGDEPPPEEIRRVINQTADDLGDKGKDAFYGYGKLNTFKAVQLFGTPGEIPSEVTIPEPEEREYFEYGRDDVKLPRILVPDEFVGICKEGVSKEELIELNQRYGIQLLDGWMNLGNRFLYQLKLPAGLKLNDVLTPFGKRRLPEIKAMKVYWNEEIIEMTLPIFKPAWLHNTIDVRYQNELDNSTISQDLKQDFNRRHPLLSPQADVTILTAGSEWQITDGNHEYLIRKEADRLNIFYIPKAPVLLMDQFTVEFKSQGRPLLDELNRQHHVTVLPDKPYIAEEDEGEYEEYKLRITRKSDLNTLDMANLYHQQSFIKRARPNVGVQTTFFDIPNDEYFKNNLLNGFNQWYLDGWNNVDINAPEAWDITTGDPNEPIVIAIIGYGVDFDHPDLRNRIIRGGDGNFATGQDGQPPEDFNGHSTRMAGIAAAQTNNNIGIAGVGWNVKILPVKIKHGVENLNPDKVKDAIKYAAKHADVINISWGDWPDLEDLREGIEYAVYDQKRLVVCAAGNSSNANPNFPSYYSDTCWGVMRIGAISQEGFKAPYSNYECLDVVAPSSPTTESQDMNLVTTQIGGSYALSGSTSATAPQVSGAAALVIAAYRKIHPGENPLPNKIREIIRYAADDMGIIFDNDDSQEGYDNWYGYGKLNAFKAVQYFGGVITGNRTWEKRLSWGEIRREDPDVILAGDVTIAPGATLTIEPGVKIHFRKEDYQSGGVDDKLVEIIVQGTLNANGQRGSPIIFEPHSSTFFSRPAWYGIRFTGNQTGGISNYEIRGAKVGISREGGDVMGAIPFTIDDCIVENSTSHGIFIYQSAVTINNSKIRNNGGDGIYVQDCLNVVNYLRNFLIFGRILGDSGLTMRLKPIGGKTTFMVMVSSHWLITHLHTQSLQ